MLVYDKRGSGLAISPRDVLPASVDGAVVTLHASATASIALDAVELIACSLTEPAQSPHDAPESEDELETAVVYARSNAVKQIASRLESVQLRSVPVPSRVDSLDYVDSIALALATSVSPPSPPRVSTSRWTSSLIVSSSVAERAIKLVAVGRRDGKIVATATTLVDISEKLAKLASVVAEPELRIAAGGIEIVPAENTTALLWRRTVGSLELEPAGEYSTRSTVTVASTVEAVYVASTRSRDGASSSPGVRVWTPERRRKFSTPTLSIVPADRAIELRLTSPMTDGWARIARKTGAGPTVSVASARVYRASPLVVTDQPPVGRTVYTAVVVDDGGLEHRAPAAEFAVESARRESMVVVSDPRVDELVDGHSVSVRVTSVAPTRDASASLAASDRVASGRFFERELSAQREQYDPLVMVIAQRVDLDTGEIVELGIVSTGSLTDTVLSGRGTRLRYVAKSALRHPLSLIKGRIAFTGSSSAAYPAETSKFLHPLALDLGQLSSDPSRQFVHAEADAAIACSAFGSCVDVTLSAASDDSLTMEASQTAPDVVEVLLSDIAHSKRDGYVIAARFDDGGWELVSYVHPALGPTKRINHKLRRRCAAVSYVAAAVNLDGAVKAIQPATVNIS